MNRGLLLRAFRESWVTTLGFGLALLGVEAALTFVLTKFGAQISREMLDFERRIMQAMLGAEVSGQLGPQMLQSIVWVHPVVFALLLAHAIMSCTRVPVGEVDRGTVDVLFSLPVSRWQIFLSESFIWVVSGATVLAAAFAGNALGGLAFPPEQRAEVWKMLLAVLNLFCLYFAVSGFTWLLSSLSNRRGRAMTTVFIVFLGFFLLGYLAQFWQPLERFVFLSPLQYHRPYLVFLSGIGPWKDMAILIGIGGTLWVAAGFTFSRRDLCTV
jgi:ABC-2 type transport system permease protein